MPVFLYEKSNYWPYWLKMWPADLRLNFTLLWKRSCLTGSWSEWTRARSSSIPTASAPKLVQSWQHITRRASRWPSTRFSPCNTFVSLSPTLAELSKTNGVRFRRAGRSVESRAGQVTEVHTDGDGVQEAEVQVRSRWCTPDSRSSPVTECTIMSQPAWCCGLWCMSSS